jgi:hypothetical protein
MKAFEITPTMTIAELQAAFATVFPFLKLDLYRMGDELGATHENRHLSEVSALRHPFSPVRIHSSTSVADFSELLWTQCGIQAEVLRKSGYTWVDTQYTVNWSLARQNEKGQEVSLAFR